MSEEQPLTYASVGVDFDKRRSIVERYKDVTRLATRPEVLSGVGPFTGHRIEGTGVGFVPGNYRADLAHAVVAVSDADAMATTRRLAREEGLFAGISSGANVWASLQVAQQLGPGQRVVTMLSDTGERYLSVAL